MAEKQIPRVAYFCMEYGLHEEFPIYAGGLGVLAGDYMKAAHDLRLPVVGLGLLWREGYTRQRIGPDGRPLDEYPTYPGKALEDTGVTALVPVGAKEVECRIFKVTRYGNAPLYLLEPAREDERWMTRRLYGGKHSDRVLQEQLLGVGGVRALRALGLEVDVYHFNEGHAVLAGVELIAEKMKAGLAFREAWSAVKPHIVFSTHTPVEAGNEVHSHELLRAAGAYGPLGYEQMATLGGDPFGMTVAGLRLACRANAVSALHGETARHMWRHVEGAAPIASITNGVHAGSWQDERIRAAMKGERPLPNVRRELKAELFQEVKERAGVELDIEALTIGFARRAATYKRADLILRDPQRIERHLDAGRLQIIFAGKAHPNDEHGKSIVAHLVSMARKYPRAVVFLENYDMHIGRLLTRGCDVWLNNPRRPMEASGTSGMKAAMNGVLNLSILDGWWPEGCVHGVNGWQIGDHANASDERDLDSLYHVLETEVLRVWATDRPRWTAMMKASIEMAQYRFSAERMVREYFEVLYAHRPDAVRVAG